MTRTAAGFVSLYPPYNGTFHWGVQRGGAPLRFYSSPFVEDASQAHQRGIQGDWLGVINGRWALRLWLK